MAVMYGGVGGGPQLGYHDGEKRYSLRTLDCRKYFEAGLWFRFSVGFLGFFLCALNFIFGCFLLCVFVLAGRSLGRV